MGAIFNINFSYFDNFKNYYDLTKETHEFFPFMLQATKNLKDVCVPNCYSLIFGNEGSGLSRDFLNIGTPVIIKHSREIDSLNLDNAVSIALYEFTKNIF